MNEPIKVDFKGPMFKTDAGKTTKKLIGKIVTEVAKEGKSEVRASLVKGHGRDSGAFRKSIKRKKPNRFFARIFTTNAAIGAWLEGTSRRNVTTRFKGYHIFRMARQRVDRGAGAHARRQIRQLIKELNG